MNRVLLGFGVAMCLAVVGAFGTSRVTAQGTNATAYCYLDTAQFLGAVQPTETGWQWSVACAFNDTAVGHRSFSGSILTQTVSGDNLATTAQKIANSVKVDGTLHGFNVTIVLLPQTAFVTPTN